MSHTIDGTTWGPAVVRTGALDMQVCVPAAFTDGDATSFANRANPCGTEHGWAIRREGSPLLAGCRERVPCKNRPGYVHIMFDA